MFDAYCARKSLDVGQVRFLFDGQRVNDYQTPAEVRCSLRPSFVPHAPHARRPPARAARPQLEIENDDCIDAMMMQVGGC